MGAADKTAVDAISLFKKVRIIENEWTVPMDLEVVAVAEEEIMTVAPVFPILSLAYVGSIEGLIHFQFHFLLFSSYNLFRIRFTSTVIAVILFMIITRFGA